jgi:hypothetical protein
MYYMETLGKAPQTFFMKAIAIDKKFLTLSCFAKK